MERSFSSRVLRTVPPWVIWVFWRRYSEAFAPLQRKSICRQTYHLSEFVRMMLDPDFLKVFVFEGLRPRWANSLGFGVLALNSALRGDKLPWVSGEGLKSQFPEVFPYLGYIPCIFVRVEEQGRGAANFLFTEFSRLLVAEKLYAVGFDFSSANSVLPKVIMRAVVGARELGEGDHDTQHYRIMVPPNIPSDGEALIANWRAQ